MPSGLIRFNFHSKSVKTNRFDVPDVRWDEDSKPSIFHPSKPCLCAIRFYFVEFPSRLHTNNRLGFAGTVILSWQALPDLTHTQGPEMPAIESCDCKTWELNSNGRFFLFPSSSQNYTPTRFPLYLNQNLEDHPSTSALPSLFLGYIYYIHIEWYPSCTRNDDDRIMVHSE